MEATIRLIKQYSDQKHPLGLPIQQQDIPILLERLQNRLGLSTGEMELSPHNLRKMEKKLESYYASLQDNEQKLEGEALVEFIRELTVYIGEFIRTNANGSWDENNIGLWTTHVSVDGPWDVRKDTHFISQLPTAFSVAYEAAFCWDKIINGEKPTLYKLYKVIRSRKLREDL